MEPTDQTKTPAGPGCTDAQQIDCMRHNEENWPVPPEVCAQCGQNKNAPAVDPKEAKRLEKLEKRRADGRERMRKIRAANPRYCQPKVIRATIGYCPKCNKAMPWSDAEGVQNKELLTCPVCKTVLKTLAEAAKVGKSPMRRAGLSYCTGCKKADLWQRAKTRRGHLVCCDCGTELHAMRDQPEPGTMGGNRRKKKEGEP